jgi:membrane fusion protein (multidrug efflux system)
MSRARIVFISLTTAIGLAAGVAYLLGRGVESTDDATVEGRITNISSRVIGQVQKVYVFDNQLVRQGEPLFELDTTELEARLVAAQADLSAARAGLKSAEADVVSARSRFKLAELELARVKKLRADGVVAAFEVDAKQSQYDQAKAAYEQATARLGRNGKNATAVAATASDKGGKDDADVGAGLAKVEQAEAALKLAEVNLSYAKVLAPSTGIVSRRSVEAGQMVSPLTPLLALVNPDDVWVVANFKEDQIREMRPGQQAVVRVDAYGGRKFSGRVESLAGATGSKFALLPPDNASGNFVKVVQRVPVLIRLSEPPHESDGAFALRPGMSVDVKVRTDDDGKAVAAADGDREAGKDKRDAG